MTSKSQLAASLGVSRACVTQMLRLLKLRPAVQAMILRLGDPLSEAIVTERMLRRIVSLPWHQQEAKIARMIAGKPRDRVPTLVATPPHLATLRMSPRPVEPRD